MDYDSVFHLAKMEVIVMLIVCVAAVLVITFLLMPNAAKQHRYEVCMASERFSDEQCRYISDALYYDMGGP